MLRTLERCRTTVKTFGEEVTCDQLSSEDNAVTQTGIPASDEEEGNVAALEQDVERAMNMNSIEDQG